MAVIIVPGRQVPIPTGASVGQATAVGHPVLGAMRWYVSICGNAITSASGSPVGMAGREVFVLTNISGRLSLRLPIRRQGDIGADSGLECHPTPGDPDQARDRRDGPASAPVAGDIGKNLDQVGPVGLCHVR